MKSPLEARSSLTIERRFNESEQPPISTSDVTVSATTFDSTDSSGISLIEAAEGENLRIEYLAIRNSSTTTAGELRVFLIPSGGSPGVTANAILVETVAANTTRDVSEAVGYQLLPGEKILVFTNTASITLIAFARLKRITQGA